jgi:hypothetical protein
VRLQGAERARPTRFFQLCEEPQSRRAVMTALTPNDLPPDHPARLLTIAHERLSSHPATPSGMKSIVVAAYGAYAVHLIVFEPVMPIHSVAPLWVELHHACGDGTLDSAGCHDLSEAIAAAEQFSTEAKMLNAHSAKHAP